MFTMIYPFPVKYRTKRGALPDEHGLPAWSTGTRRLSSPPPSGRSTMIRGRAVPRRRPCPTGYLSRRALQHAEQLRYDWTTERAVISAAAASGLTELIIDAMIAIEADFAAPSNALGGSDYVEGSISATPTQLA